MHNFGNVYGSFNEAAVGTGALNPGLQSQMSVFNAPYPHLPNGQHVDLVFEAYDKNEPDEYSGQGRTVSAIPGVTEAKRKALYNRAKAGQAYYAELLPGDQFYPEMDNGMTS